MILKTFSLTYRSPDDLFSGFSVVLSIQVFRKFFSIFIFHKIGGDLFDHGHLYQILNFSKPSDTKWSNYSSIFSFSIIACWHIFPTKFVVTCIFVICTICNQQLLIGDEMMTTFEKSPIFNYCENFFYFEQNVIVDSIMVTVWSGSNGTIKNSSFILPDDDISCVWNMSEISLFLQNNELVMLTAVPTLRKRFKKTWIIAPSPFNFSRPSTKHIEENSAGESHLNVICFQKSAIWIHKN